MAAQGWNPTRQTQLPPHFIIIIVVIIIIAIVIIIIVVAIIVVLVIVVVPSGELADGRLVCVADHLFVSLHHHHPPHDHLHHPPHDDHHHPHPDDVFDTNLKWFFRFVRPQVHVFTSFGCGGHWSVVVGWLDNIYNLKQK